MQRERARIYACVRVRGASTPPVASLFYTMNNLEWFKFSPSDWMMGRIQRQTPQVQSDFIRLCCIYWHKRAEVSEDAAQMECVETFETLVKYKFITINDGMVSIKFLDDQMVDIDAKRLQASEAGKRSAEARKRKAKANDRSTTVQRPINEIQQSKSKSKSKSKNINTPTRDQVIDYFIEKGYTKDAGAKAFEYYDLQDWKDANGKPVKNWKAKMLAVWFKDENKSKNANITAKSIIGSMRS